MTIELLYVRDCPNRSFAREQIDRALLATGLSAVVREREVRTSEEASRFGMRGSPTILIDGRDPFEAATGFAGLSCRLYVSERGGAGAPTVEQLIRVLTE